MKNNPDKTEITAEYARAWKTIEVAGDSYTVLMWELVIDGAGQVFNDSGNSSQLSTKVKNKLATLQKGNRIFLDLKIKDKKGIVMTLSRSYIIK